MIPRGKFPTEPDPVRIVRQGRLAGDLDGALRAVSLRLADQEMGSPLMTEGVRLLILRGEAPSAAGLYQNFPPESEQPDPLEPAALVRLALQLGRRELLDGVPAVSEPRWLKTLLETGADPCGALVPESLQVSVTAGHLGYRFGGDCPHCAHGVFLSAPDTLLTRREMLCPSCFGRLELGHRAMRCFVRESHADLLALDPAGIEEPLTAQIAPVLTGREETPPILAALGQEYRFLLNQIVIRHVLEAEDSYGGGGAS